MKRIFITACHYTKHIHVKDQSHSRSRTNHSQIINRLGLCVEKVTKFSGTEITDESRINRARTITDIPRTSSHTSKYGVVFHEHSTHARHMNHRRSASKHARFANVSGINVIRALFMRDTKVVRQWTDVDVRGFEPVPTHKHWRPTRVPRMVKHIRRINYARRHVNNAHRRTVVLWKIFKPFKTQNHAQTHIHLQLMTVHVRSTDELRIRRTLRAETKISA